MSQTKYNTKTTALKAGTKTFGIVYGDTLRKSLQGSKHFLRQPAGIAIDLEALDRAEAVGAVRIEIIDVESETVFTSTIEHFRHAGLEINRGFGQQLVLPFSGWVKRSKGTPIQLDLFQGVEYGRN